MRFKNERIHNFLIKKSSNLPFVKNEIENNGVLKITKQSLDLFAFIAKTIIAQQISYEIAKILWERLCFQLKTKTLSIKSFKNINYLKKILINTNISKAKINYITEIYKSMLKKEINDHMLLKMNNDEIISLLLRYKGIGPWTCNMILIFYFKKLNIFPENDLVIKKTRGKLNSLEKKEIDFQEIFSPYLSVFSLHLWKMSKRIL